MFIVHTLWQTISYQILNLVNTPIVHFPEIHFNVVLPFLSVSDSGCFPTAFTSHFVVHFLAHLAQQMYQYENIKFLPYASCVSSLSANFTKFWKEAAAPHSLMSVLSELWCHTMWWAGTNVLEEPVTSRVRVHSEGCLAWKCRQHVSLHDVTYWRSIRLILSAERSSYHRYLRT